MPVPKHLTVNGVRLTYDDLGEGPAVLFVHGFMLDRTLWRDQVRALDGWRRIAPDLRGMGRSEAPERGYRMSVYADDLAALLDALDVERTVLCGLSMGGYVAFEFLRRHRERVAALVVLDARAEADTAERRSSRNDMIARVRDGGTDALTAELAAKFLAENASANARRRLADMMDRSPVAGVVGALEAMRDRPDDTPFLGSIGELPTLLLIGSDDTRTPRASMRAIADAVPAATFGVVPRSGHLPPLENPAEVTDRLRHFLDGLRAPEPSADLRL
ncbi:alpha/beta fold hydrolase [Nonomuraea sp. NN258]|uniref:alpha/beta fold hydrolase n=1 Tax=Nonomuraea antri TaxID=2730852 RepID=UPI00156A30C8|nr:alpha/beta fold hydrolase [Nonomuraea antri]NRQ40710.1 alpha/beta fold hydrolase [Nonomuraea antri]